MKVKHAVFMIGVGYIIDWWGGLSKILHTPNANTILVFAAFLKAAGLLILLFKFATHPKLKDLMNS